MKIIIEEQYPDGVNVSVEGIIFDTIEEANEFSAFVTKVWGRKKIDLEECRRIFESGKK